jgi:FkbM family methyltransferase
MLCRAASTRGWRSRATASSHARAPEHQLIEYTLPNGLRIDCTSPEEVPFLYEEIYTACTYAQHGISLPSNAVVIDVGANIGLFSFSTAAAAGAGASVLAVEPMPPLFRALQSNVRRHEAWCLGTGVTPARVTPVNAAVGDGSRDSATFTYYANATGWSTMYPDDTEVLQNMSSFLDRALEHMRGIPATPLALLGRRIKNISWLRPVYEAAKQAKVRNMLNSAVPYDCSMVTLSQLIRTHGFDRVDLVKIDVERAELDVLRGVEAAHWPLIGQVVMEVHDLGSTLEDVQQLLRSVGFDRLVVEQSGDLSGSSMYNLYARRGL